MVEDDKMSICDSVRSSSTSEASNNSDRLMRKMKFKDGLGKEIFAGLQKEIARNVSISSNRDRLRKVLQVPLNKRAEEDIQELIKAMQNLDFFKQKFK